MSATEQLITKGLQRAHQAHATVQDVTSRMESLTAEREELDSRKALMQLLEQDVLSLEQGRSPDRERAVTREAQRESTEVSR